jgi:hypothetical protein
VREIQASVCLGVKRILIKKQQKKFFFCYLKKKLKQEKNVRRNLISSR